MGCQKSLVVFCYEYSTRSRDTKRIICLNSKSAFVKNNNNALYSVATFLQTNDILYYQSMCYIKN